MTKLVLLLLLAPQGRPAEYEVVVRKNVKVPMRDGVTLATDLTLPKADGKWPAILTRTPYGRGGGASIAKYYASR